MSVKSTVANTIDRRHRALAGDELLDGSDDLRLVGRAELIVDVAGELEEAGAGDRLHVDASRFDRRDQIPHSIHEHRRNWIEPRMARVSISAFIRSSAAICVGLAAARQ